MRTDQPETADWAALREASGEQGGDREVLRQKLERLPPGHPSSPDQPDDTKNDQGPQPADTEHGNRDSADAPKAPADGGPGSPPRKPDDDGDWRPLTDAEYADHVTKVRALLDKARADGLETMVMHTTDADHEQWTEERTLMHDAIIAAIYGSVSEVPCERRAMLAGGLPGAGKTTVLEQDAGVDRSRYLTINPDHIKEEMAKRGMIPDVAGLTPMEASDLVHEESSHVAKRMARRAMREGKNVIWDITMSSPESTEKRIADLRDSGYAPVDGIFVDIPVEVAVRRTDARHRMGHDDYRAGQGLGGRFVPAEVAVAQADPEWGSRNRKTFEQVKPKLDAWARYDNSVEGRAPVLAESSERDEGSR